MHTPCSDSLVMLALAVLLTACAAQNDDTGAPDLDADPAEGELLYAERCSGCHGDAGLGEEESGYPGATNLTEFAGRESAIVSVVLEGTAGMPPIALTQKEAEDVAAYVVMSLQK